MRHRVEVLHGVNLGTLGQRPAEHYGTITLAELEAGIAEHARTLGLDVSFMQTDHEGNYCEHIHRARELADGLIVNPGAWTHYSYAIRDALEVTGLPVVEVHISDVDHREPWRRVSVIRDVCFATVIGKGPDGYREALELLAQRFADDE